MYDLPELGEIIIRRNSRSRRISLRISAAEVVLTLPTTADIGEGYRFLERHREKIVARILEYRSDYWNEYTAINALTFTGRIERKKVKEICSTLKKSQLRIYVPLNLPIDNFKMQLQLRKQLEPHLLSEAQKILPEYTDQLARRHGFTFLSVKVNKSRGRWGSCSKLKRINLSFFLILLPTHLVEFIILHELCHTVEMNHGPRFWELLDKVTEGKASEYTNELKEYHTW